MYKSTLLLGFLLLMLAGCASIHHRDLAQLRIVPASDATSEPAKWQEIMKEIQEGKELVFHIREGQRIPLKVSLTHPVIKLLPGKNDLVFTRDVYLLISRSKMEISLDGQRWAAINDLKSQRALFGIEKRALFVSFGSTQEEGTQITVDIFAK
jgi:hypothetical protein